MNKLIHSLILILCSGMASTLVAQVKEDTLKGGEILIKKDFEPTISDASKILEEPKVKSVEIPEVKFKYDFLSKMVPTTFTPDSIKAARMKGEPLERLYRGYARAGFGNYGTTMANVYLNNLRSRNAVYGLRLNHLRTQGNIKDVATSTASTNGVEAHGNYFLRAHQVGGKIAYNRDAVHFYGFDDGYYQYVMSADDIKDNDIKQYYSKVDANLMLESFFADSNVLNYAFNFDYYNLQDNYNTQENFARLDAKLDRFFGQEQGILNAALDFNDISSGYDTTNNLIIELNPQIIFRGEKWRISVGLKAMVEAENETEYRFYPNAHIKYNVVGDLLIPYIGVTGGLERQNFNTLRLQNPYVNPASALANENTRYEVYGGVRGAYNSTLAFNLRASRSQVANVAMFVNAYDGFHDIQPGGPTYYFPTNSTFNVLYDTLDITHISGEISYNNIKKLKLIARGDFWDYNAKNQPEVWHMPTFKATVTGNYDLKDKIILTADIFYISKQYARSLNASDGDRVEAGVYAKELDGTVDINIGAEYRLNKKLSGFIQFNNLAAIEYEKYNNYPTQRFSFLAGVSYSFWGE